MRLSSDNIFKFVNDAPTIDLILQHGFRHTLWSENLPYKTFIQENYMVCFCDILWSQNSFHRQCYGNNAIVMTKDWAINNQISPVRYIHSKSPFTSDGYIKRKTYDRECVQTQTNPSAQVLLTSMIETLIATNVLNQQSLIAQTKVDENLKNELNRMEDEYTAMQKAIASAGHLETFEKFLFGIHSRIRLLHNELELRDALVRVYKDRFIHPITGVHPDKVLYDEREWRSIKMSTQADAAISAKNKYLGESYNLKFSETDVVAILLEQPSDRDRVKLLIKSGNTMLARSAINKVMLINDYKE